MKTFNRKITRAAIFMAVFAVCVLCCLLSRSAYSDLAKGTPIVTYHGLESMTAADYNAIAHTENLARTPLRYSLWTQIDNQTLEAPGTGRKSEVSVLLIYGDSRLVLPVTQTLSAEDLNGCLLDRKTAINLFGTDKAAGCMLQYSGKEYMVRDIMDGPLDTVLFQVDATNPFALPNISVAGAANADTFSMRHGLSPTFVTNTGTYAEIAGILSALPIAAALLVVLHWLRGYCIAWRHYILRYGIISLLMLMLGVALIVFATHLLPRSLIPSRWSDFGFWGDAFAQSKMQLISFVTVPKFRPDLPLLYSLLQSSLGLVGARLVVGLYSLRRCFCAHPNH